MGERAISCSRSQHAGADSQWPITPIWWASLVIAFVRLARRLS